MKFATFDELGVLSGRYDSDIHAVIPQQAIELSDAVFLATRTERDGVWTLEDGVVAKRPFPVEAPDYPGLFAAQRFAREACGITVDGLAIETTRDSQALISSTGLSAMLDPEYRCNFKTLGGFVEIDAAQILVIAKAIRGHVQACFDRESTLLKALETGTYKDEMLNEGWPDSALKASTANLQ
ncbi:DUF4376 domain-containing protein [Pseudomonas botevensis]|uniref:DUF4376 domain-containing protein n=1 Tax=Pseudomonas botevensis TaxID=2842352 RepID=UPI001C3DFD4D|nr:DUF4376 domain-containing protein [Pseudomonas botevensis]MBV4476159.1 DUF4376 domain-containing protein [Pseudomonas botevensis]